MSRSGRLLDRSVVIVALVVAACAVGAAQDTPVTVTLTDAQLERMLERLSVGESARLLNLRSYVVVVGRSPDVPIFGENADLGTEAAQNGASMHSEMMAVTRPDYLSQAAGSDNLGIATATAFSVLVPAALKAVAGWLDGDDDDEAGGPRFAGYTRTLRLEPNGDATSSLPFYRTDGQPVVISLQLADSPTDGVRISIDDRELGVFDESVRDMGVPDELLSAGPGQGMHLLAVSTVSDRLPEEPVEVDVVVVVYAADS